MMMMMGMREWLVAFNTMQDVNYGTLLQYKKATSFVQQLNVSETWSTSSRTPVVVPNSRATRSSAAL